MPRRSRLLSLLSVLVVLAAACGGDSPGGQVESVAARVSVVSSTTATSSTSTAVSPTTSAPRRPITLGFAGDTTLDRGLTDLDPFGGIADLMQEPDLMVLNLETAIADPDVGRPPVAKSFLFKSPPSALPLLVEAGVDVVALANNHTLDFGAEALAQTLEEIDAVGLARVGAGRDQNAAYQPLVLEVGDWQIGLVSLSRVPCDWSASGENVRPQVAWACPPFLDLADAMVNAAIAAADVTIVMVHGGEEGVLCPSDFMVELEERWAGLGVDAVIDGHPHVLQGITSIDDTLVVHSTGNFAFPAARGITANSAIFLLDVSEDGVTLRVEPVRGPGGVLAKPTDAQRTEILAQINDVSAGLQLDGDGVAQVAPDVTGSC